MCFSEKDECNKKGETGVNENEAKKLKQKNKQLICDTLIDFC
jgi:hypothetical protein